MSLKMLEILLISVIWNIEAAGAKICSQTEAFQKELVLKVRTPQKLN